MVRNINHRLGYVLMLLAFVPAFIASARQDIGFDFSFNGLTSSGQYAPSLMGSLNGGKDIMKSEIYVDIKVAMPVDTTKRFSYGFGVEALGGYFHDIAYHPVSENKMFSSRWQPGAVRLQQLYADLKYRSIALSAGMRAYESGIVDSRLSSGDVVRSVNARPIPHVQLGFVDYQDIPFTNGFMQINGAVSYGRTFDFDFQKSINDLTNGIFNNHTYYTYKYLHLRTNPVKPFSVVFGLQTGSMFGGKTTIYKNGQLTEVHDRGFKIKDIFKMLVPIEGNGDNYYEGNTVGSWDMKATYRIDDGSRIAGYFQWLFEDGSGIGKQNGWDGLWGIEYHPVNLPWIKGVVAEYLDFTNQSGPIHHSVPSNPGTTISDCSGADSYYMNFFYGPYANYGLSIGSPFFKAPFYNLDGKYEFKYTRIRGCHFGVEGDVMPDKLSYRLVYSYQIAYGNAHLVRKHPLQSNSFMGELTFDASCITPGLSVTAKIAADTGKLWGKNTGGMLSVRYSFGLSTLTKSATK